MVNIGVATVLRHAGSAETVLFSGLKWRLQSVLFLMSLVGSHCSGYAGGMGMFIYD